MNESEFKKLKEKHEEAAEAASEAKGALTALKERLKKEFGVRDTKEAGRLLKDLQKKRDRLEREFEEELASYRKEFPDE